MRTKLKILFPLLVVLIILLGFTVPVNLTGGWYQQFMPFLNNRPISDITFLDSLTGYAVTGDGTVGDTNFIIKTTNSGDAWTIIYDFYRDFSKIKFINSNTGYVSGGFNASCAFIIKTTNAGQNWNTINTPCILYINDIAVINENIIWIAGSNSFDGGVYRTTNGGASWDRQLNLGSSNPNHIYMFNERIGFIARGQTYLRKTTNSGLNWDIVTGANGFVDMHFIDSLTGWKAIGLMQKSTNGGLNWVIQQLPQGGNIITSQIENFDNVNADTIWGVGGSVFYGSGRFRGIIYKTTNGGNNWGFQLPDTSINIGKYIFIEFANKLNGWAYSSNTGIHTTSGGDTTWYMGIRQLSNTIPKDFILKQNYPNPFNPRTVIPYSLKSSGHVKLIAYDILGKEVQVMVDNYQQAGEYEVDFMGKFSSSGVYFYRMSVDDKVVDTKRMILIK